jgi:hypothetical protein
LNVDVEILRFKFGVPKYKLEVLRCKLGVPKYEADTKRAVFDVQRIKNGSLNVRGGVLFFAFVLTLPAGETLFRFFVNNFCADYVLTGSHLYGGEWVYIKVWGDKTKCENTHLFLFPLFRIYSHAFLLLIDQAR